MKSIFSIDVEDWYHILDLPSTPDLEKWNSLPSFVEKNFLKLLDLLVETNTRVTCFFLGWVAKKFPHLVREASARGHEIASHGFAHRLVYAMTPDEFWQDLLLSKTILESVVGKPILGYRTSGFSVTEQTPWFFEKIVQAGYAYDSSVFPAPRGHGGMKTDKLGPYVIETASGNLLEFPITVTKVVGRPLCVFGGGYLRLAPYPVIRGMTRKVLAENRPVIFYVHPREIDPSHPRLAMGFVRRFKSYVNLQTTEEKIRRLAADFSLTTFENFISEYSKPVGGEMADRSVAEFFDSYSVNFNALYGSRKNALNYVIDRLFRKSMRLRFERTVQGCMPIEGKSVLDVGCGPGHYSVHLAARGARHCFGLDFAPGMIRLAKEHALCSSVADRCEFVCDDFATYSFDRQFDYVVAMGFMDYIEKPEPIIDRILSLTCEKAFFSFPVEGGILAWQRKQRYKKRCQLFLYRYAELNELFARKKCKRFTIEKISRDFFVTVSL